MSSIILHIDFDYFFAQCEEIRNITLKTKPVIICVYSNRDNDSGVIATANYIAREYGINSGMPIKTAKNIMGNIKTIFLPIDQKYYSTISTKAMIIIKEYANIFEYVGKDEAYLDVTKNSNMNFDNAIHIAQQIKNTIKDKINLTCSIGISTNKVMAKIASSYNKPDGLTIIKQKNINKFLESLDIKKIPGIGKKTIEKITEKGYHTITELKKLDVFTLNNYFGKKTGVYIYNTIRGIDYRHVEIKKDTNQISKIITLKQDSNEYEYILEYLNRICIDIHKKIINNKKKFRNIEIYFVKSNLTIITRSKRLIRHTSNKIILEKNAKDLLYNINKSCKIRRIGIRVYDIKNEDRQDITKFF